MNFFKNYPQVLDCYSTKQAGDMNWRAENVEALKRRGKFLQTQQVALENLVTAGLVHGDKIAIVSAKDAGKIMPDTDALITRDKNVFLSVTFADCLPIFYFVPEYNIVGLAHAGWRGAAKNLSSKMLQVLSQEFRVKTSEILLGIGPHICQQHYQVGAEVVQVFGRYPEALDNSYLDLEQVVKTQLLEAGLPAANISTSNLCTFERDGLFFSYRRDKSQDLQIMLAVIGLR